MPASLRDTPPADLVSLPDESLLAAARAVTEWSRVEAEALDHALRHRVLAALVGRADDEALGALYDLLGRLVPPSRHPELAALGRDYPSRWRAWADLVDGRRAELAARDPGRVEKRAHVGELLALVRAEPGLSQAEVASRLGLSRPNLTRIVALLEDHGLLERRTVGREKRLHAPAAAPLPEVARPPRPTRAARRGLAFLVAS